MSIAVNGVAIADGELRREAHLQSRAGAACDDSDAASAARVEAARALVVRELLLQEAHRCGLLTDLEASEPEQEDAIRRLTEKAVPVAEAEESECRTFFEEHRDRFRGPDLFEPSHILFAAPPDSAEARVEALTAARASLAELARDPGRFERIAGKRSACPSGARGGSLGQITRGETEPPFERHILELEVGEISQEPIETDHGFHIVRLDERARGELLPFEAVSERIRIYLRDRAWRRELQAFIADLAGKAVIQGFSFTA